MAKKQPYAFVYDPDAVGHLDAIDRKYHSLIRTSIEVQLKFEPDTPTRNRKRLKESVFGARWELRFGPTNRFRVFYRVNEEAREVDILAIGVKERNRLMIGGEEVQP